MSRCWALNQAVHERRGSCLKARPFRDAYSTNCPSKHDLTLFSFPPYSSKLWTSIFKIGSQFLCRFIRELLSVCVVGGEGVRERGLRKRDHDHC